MIDKLLKNIRNDSFTNLLVRAFSILLKFGFNLYLIKLLEISDYGVYILFSTSIIICTLLLGFDYYKNIHRSLINLEKTSFSEKLGEQMWFLFFNYSIFLPLFFFLFYQNYIPSKFLVLFYSILILEHLNQEIFRLLNLTKRPVLANFLQFCRSVLWSAVILLQVVILNSKINLNTIFIYWLTFQILTLILSFFVLKSKLSIRHLFKFPTFKTLNKGFLIALPFFIGTIFLKINEYSSRYFLSYFSGEESVGIFGFYSNITNVLNVLVFAGVTSIHLPLLLEAAKLNNNALLIRSITFFKSLKGYTIGFSLILGIGIYPLLVIIEKNELIGQLPSFFLLLGSSSLLAFAGYYQNLLYVLSQDMLILKGTFISAVVSIGSNFLFVPTYNILGASIACVLGSLVLLVCNRYYYIKVKNVVTDEIF